MLWRRAELYGPRTAALFPSSNRVADHDRFRPGPGIEGNNNQHQRRWDGHSGYGQTAESRDFEGDLYVAGRQPGNRVQSRLGLGRWLGTCRPAFPRDVAELQRKSGVLVGATHKNIRPPSVLKCMSGSMSPRTQVETCENPYCPALLEQLQK